MAPKKRAALAALLAAVFAAGGLAGCWGSNNAKCNTENAIAVPDKPGPGGGSGGRGGRSGSRTKHKPAKPAKPVVVHDDDDCDDD